MQADKAELVTDQVVCFESQCFQTNSGLRDRFQLPNGLIGRVIAQISQHVNRERVSPTRPRLTIAKASKATLWATTAKRHVSVIAASAPLHCETKTSCHHAETRARGEHGNRAWAGQWSQDSEGCTNIWPTVWRPTSNNLARTGKLPD